MIRACCLILAAMLAGLSIGLVPSIVHADDHESPLPPRPARINHLAFMTLHDESQIDDLIADCDAMVAAIPKIVSYYAGTNLDTGRTTVDGAYSVGFYVGFETDAAYAAYVSHEAHVALVDKWRPHLQSLRVHDVLDETP